MAEDSAKVVRIARRLAIAHIIIGIALFAFGIADRFQKTWTGKVYFGIWIGLWMIFTGGLGIPSSNKENTAYRNAFATVFGIFAIISTLFGVTLMGCYGRLLNKSSGAETVIAVFMLILGLVTFGIGVWASIMTCLIPPVAPCCVDHTTEGPKAGYIVQQGAAGVPVQADSSVITIHTSPPRAQGEMQPTCYPPQQLTAVTGYTPQQVQFSQAGHSGAMVSGYPPQPFQAQFVQAGQSGAMVSGYPSQPFQPQFVQAGQSGATFTGYPPQQI